MIALPTWPYYRLVNTFVPLSLTPSGPVLARAGRGASSRGASASLPNCILHWCASDFGQSLAGMDDGYALVIAQRI